MKKRGDIEQIFIKNANFEFLPDFRPARGKNGENEGVRNGGKNDRNKIIAYAGASNFVQALAAALGKVCAGFRAVPILGLPPRPRRKSGSTSPILAKKCQNI